jgi:23S rRNA pseudouridine2605 synthase
MDKPEKSRKKPATDTPGKSASESKKKSAESKQGKTKPVAVKKPVSKAEATKTAKVPSKAAKPVKKAAVKKAPSAEVPEKPVKAPAKKSAGVDDKAPGAVKKVPKAKAPVSEVKETLEKTPRKRAAKGEPESPAPEKKPTKKAAPKKGIAPPPEAPDKLPAREKPFGKPRKRHTARKEKPFRKEGDADNRGGKGPARPHRKGLSPRQSEADQTAPEPDKPIRTDSNRRSGPADRKRNKYQDRKPRTASGDHDRKPPFPAKREDDRPQGDRPPSRDRHRERPYEREQRHARSKGSRPPGSPDEGMRLNKFVAHCGIASRRDAVILIKNSMVQVNGKTVTEIGFKVQPRDIVTYRGKRIRPQRFEYVLLNKPKDFITTTSDERGRDTVIGLVQHITHERVYPVGRLDRNTTGLLLLTNDGDLAQKLTHPSYKVEKVYAVTLDKPLTKQHFDDILNGKVLLEEGEVPVDDLAWTNPEDKREIGIALHIGWNRVVRRLFENFGYQVKKLDRVVYAGLTKKDLPRGKCRVLTDKEVIMLKHFK